MSLKITGQPRPFLTIFITLAIGLLVGFSIKSIGYFWVMLIPNLLLLFITLAFLFAYLEADKKSTKIPKQFPMLSVLVPCFNSKNTIIGTINAIKASDYPGKMEIIVVDDGSTDGSREILQKINGIKTLFLEKNMGKAAALNRAIPIARGEVIACVDSDTYPEPSAFRYAVAKLLENKKYGAVTCFIKVANANTILKKIQEIEYYTGFGFAAVATHFLDAIFVAPGPTTIFRKDALLKVGLFDEKNITEDLEIAWRLRKFGYSLGYSVDAVVKTEVPDTLGALFKQRLRWYRGKLFNLKKYSDMVFNPAYGNFGMFVLPFSFSAELAGVILSFSFAYILLNQIIWYIRYIFSMFITGNIPLDLSGFAVVGPSALAMAFILMLPWFIAVYFSHLLAKHELKLSDIPNTFIFLFFYGTVISFFYCVSFLKEINKSDYVWK